MEIGKRIKKIRQEKALKQEDFGALLGTNRSVIGRLETGRQTIDQDFLDKIWTTFGVSPHWLVTGEDLGSALELSNLKKEVKVLKDTLAEVRGHRDSLAHVIELMQKIAGVKPKE